MNPPRNRVHLSQKKWVNVILKNLINLKSRIASITFFDHQTPSPLAKNNAIQLTVFGLGSLLSHLQTVTRKEREKVAKK